MLRRLMWVVPLLLLTLVGTYALLRTVGDPATAPDNPAPSAATPPLAAYDPVQPTALASDLTPYADATVLLDGVCFDALVALSGQAWVWRSQADLADFYDQVDTAGWCAEPVSRGDFDFAQGLLVGTTTAATGCDAAYRVLSLSAETGANRLVLHLGLHVIPGCPYELVEPVLMVLPPSTKGTPLTVEVSALP